MRSEPLVGDLSEKEILARISERTGRADNALVGPGDDAAVLRVTGSLIATTDTLIEGPDFRSEWSDGYSLGWKAAAVNLSDVAAMGGRPGMTDEDGKLVYIKEGRMFIVTPPIDGQPACHANGGTIGFALHSPQEVHAWQDAGVAQGGSAIEAPAGVRHKAGRQLYLAYLRDPDGNKLCGVHVMD